METKQESYKEKQKEIVKLKKENQQLRMQSDRKVSHIDNKTKVAIIRTNRKKYRIIAMCKFLKISCGAVYYKYKDKPDEADIENAVIEAFKASKNKYGTRTLKAELATDKYKIRISRPKIRDIMTKHGLIARSKN